MASYLPAIRKAIKAAGFQLDDFEIHSTGCEPNWAKVGLAGKQITLDDNETVRAQNRRLGKVARALQADGYRVTIYTAAHGGQFLEVNVTRHYGHTVGYCNPASAHHY